MSHPHAAHGAATVARAAPLAPATGAATQAVMPLFEAVFEQAAVGMALLAPDGRWMRANPALCAILGRSAVELSLTTYQTLTRPAGRAADAESLRDLATGARPAYELEQQLRHGDGSWVWVRASFALVREADGTPWLVVAQMEDTTERHAREAAQSSTVGELRRSNLELEAFASIASHDLQEPLRKIRAFGDRLQAKYSDRLDEQGADYIARMQSAAARMQQLIDELLVYARVTASERPAERIDLATLARDVISDLEVQIEESGSRVVVEQLPVVSGDPGQLRQLLQNLLGNALKFRAPDRLPEVRVQAVERDGQVEISVTDNGIGFEPEAAERIFAPLARLHGRAAYAGTGMGLAIARRIAERHGGALRAEGRPDVGARFVLSLPRPSEEAETDGR